VDALSHARILNLDGCHATVLERSLHGKPLEVQKEKKKHKTQNDFNKTVVLPYVLVLLKPLRSEIHQIPKNVNANLSLESEKRIN
jgi:hypothetical protein